MFIDAAKQRFELVDEFYCAQNFTFEEFMKFCELQEGVFKKLYK